MTVITRFAPSPTGMLHIGGARTALFNALIARRHGGKFLLRIEDTDRARSTPEATAAILEAMDWLGLTPDEAPVYQSQKMDRHIACAHSMVETGRAFRCYATPEDLQARRDAGEAKRSALKNADLSDADRTRLQAEADALLAPFRSPWRDGGTPPAPNAPYTIRLKAPDQGTIQLDDKVQGQITLQAEEIDDLILLRADGTPTYMLAVVVDDHDMGVTLVLRGDDHLRNTFRQIPIYQAMNWPLPDFGHIPLIHGQDGAKLSKRHGALSTLAYRDLGYLPEGLSAYLLRLGWSHGDQEIFTMDEAKALFSVEAINKAPARLDLAKLDDINGHFIRAAQPDRLFKLVMPFIEKLTSVDDPVLRSRLEAALPGLTDRGETLPQLAEAARFLWDANAHALTKNARKALKGEKLETLGKLQRALDAENDWTIETLQNLLDSFCAQHGLTIGQVGPPLRAAVSGGLPAPDLAPVLAWLGRDEVLARIATHLPGHSPAGS